MRLVLALGLLVGYGWSQTCTITSDSTPPAVGVSQTHNFTTACPSPTWSSTDGNIDATTGVYTAPSNTSPHSQSHACQLGPINNIFNIPINSLSVNSHSATWIGRIAQEPGGTVYHHFRIPTPGAIDLYDNASNNSYPTQIRHFYYGGAWQDTAFTQVTPPAIEMEGGYLNDDARGDFDRHYFNVNKDTCDDEEIYQDYVDFKTFAFVPGNPTVINFTTNTLRPLQQPLPVVIFGEASGMGNCPSINSDPNTQNHYNATVISPTQITIPFNSVGCNLATARISSTWGLCPTCNAASGVHFPGASNALPGGVDAAGTPMSRNSLHTQEWWNNVQKNVLDPVCSCVTLKHALRTTLTNLAIAPADLWPSINGHNVTGGGHPQVFPTGATNANPAAFTINPTEINGISWMQYQLPCVNWTLTNGCTFGVVFGGGTGSWAALNGNHYTATETAVNRFTIPVDSSAWGAKPSSLYYYTDWAPYGSRFRLKAAFDKTTVCNTNSLTNKCPYEWAIINTLKYYGLILVDGTTPSDNWDSSITSEEFFPDQLIDAISDLNTNTALGYGTAGGFEQYLDIVDESGLQIYNCDYNGGSCNDPNSYLGTTATNRVTVTAAQSGHTSASLDVNLLGITVAPLKGRIAIPLNGTYRSIFTANGNPGVINYSLSPAVSGASVDSAGVITAPSSLSVTTKTILSACATNDANQCGYMDVYFLPVSASGTLRLLFGKSGTTTYTDTLGNVWYGPVVNRSWDTNYEIADGINFATLLGTWQTNSGNWTGTVDAQLYASSAAARNDLLLTIALPDGNYTLTFRGEAGYGVNGAGQNVFDLSAYDALGGGGVLESYLDGFNLAGGQFRPWTKTYNVTSAGGALTMGGYIREPSTNGIQIASVQIDPGALLTLRITTNSLPNATLNLLYIQTMMATGGRPPYQWSISSGTLPTGMTINSVTGVISGIPTAIGTSPFTVLVTDLGAIHMATKPLSLLVNDSAVQITTPAPLPSGTAGIPYSVTLTCIGGTGTYFWSVLNTGDPEFHLSPTTGIYSGNPTIPGIYNPAFRCQDSGGSQNVKQFPGLIINGSQTGFRNKFSGTSTSSGGWLIQ